MQPTFGTVINTAKGYLGDERGAVFKDPFLLMWARRAFDEMVSVFASYQCPEAMVIGAPFVVTAGTLEVDPATTTGLLDMGQVFLLTERLNLSNDKYTEVKLVDVLPQRDQRDLLLEYAHTGGKFQFVGATTDRQMKAQYYASGDSESLDETATIAVDDCLNFLAAATAAKAGPGKGYVVEAKEASAAAYGPNNPNPLSRHGGYLQLLVDAQLRTLQQAPAVPAMYRAGQFRK